MSRNKNRKETITIMSGSDATKRALREQSYSFGNIYAGTGEHKQNSRNGGLSEAQLMEEEILANTPFRDKTELLQVLNSTNWNNEITMQRLCVTIPSFGQKWNELFPESKQYALSLAKSNDRLAVLLSTVMFSIKTNTESELLRLGFTCNEVYRLKDFVTEFHLELGSEISKLETNSDFEQEVSYGD